MHYTKEEITGALEEILADELRLTEIGVKPAQIKRLKFVPRTLDRLGLEMKVLSTHECKFSGQTFMLIELTRKKRVEWSAIAEFLGGLLDQCVNWYELEFEYVIYSEDDDEYYSEIKFSADDAEDYARRQRYGGTVKTRWNNYEIDEQDFDGTDYEEPVDYWKETAELFRL